MATKGKNLYDLQKFTCINQRTKVTNDRIVFILASTPITEKVERFYIGIHVLHDVIMKKSAHFIWTLLALSFLVNIQTDIICSKIVYSKGVKPQLPEVKRIFGNGKFCMKSNNTPATVLSSLHTLVTESNFR